jgi:hypothetical protein
MSELSSNVLLVRLVGQFNYKLLFLLVRKPLLSAVS